MEWVYEKFVSGAVYNAYCLGFPRGLFNRQTLNCAQRADTLTVYVIDMRGDFLKVRKHSRICITYINYSPQRGVLPLLPSL